MPAEIEIVEVGPRDGLQNEDVPVSTAEKLNYIKLLIAAGLRRLEVTSFVHPRLVSQMADADQLMAALTAGVELELSALVLNERGAERAIKAGATRLTMVVPATDEFSMRNQRCTTTESLQRFAASAELARQADIKVTLTIAVAFGCPFAGTVDPRTIVEIVSRTPPVFDELALADTIGVATPRRVTQLFQMVAAASPAKLRAHFHNTRNTGYSNAYAAIDSGVTALDSSAGGIGGCPFAPKATGNIATEDLLWSLQRDGLATGLDQPAVMKAAAYIAGVLGKPVPALLGRVDPFPG